MKIDFMMQREGIMRKKPKLEASKEVYACARFAYPETK
jgi:hypothetical protein